MHPRPARHSTYARGRAARGTPAAALRHVLCGGLLAAAAGCPSSTQEVDPVFAASAASDLSSSDVSRWNEAAAWGDHAEAGYLDDEVDPTFTGSAAGAITTADVARWDDAISVEADPAFAASAAAGIGAADVTRWDTHDHDGRYLTEAESDARYPARATVQHLNVNSTEFVPRFLTADVDYLGGQAIKFGADPSYSFAAAVHLPDGATITQLACYLRDNDATQDLVGTSRVQLVTAGLPDYGMSFDYLATADLVTTGAAGVVTSTGAAYGNTVVDNAANQYLLTADFEIGGANSEFFDPIFRGCTITYLAP